MAKAKAHAKAKAKAEQALVANKRKMDAAVNLIDKHDIAENVAKKAKSKAESVDDRLISKMLRDNFKGWSADLCELTIRDGVSLRQRLAKDKSLQVKGLRRETMGKLYYAELRSLYGSSLSPDHLLVIDNEDEPEDHRLSSAMEGLFTRKKNYEGMHAFLGSADVLGQKNLVAPFKGCLMLNPASSHEHNALALCLLEYCKRHKLKATYPQETGVMKNYFESALVKCFLDFRKHDLSRMDFWNKHCEVMDYVLPVASAAVCFGCNGKWEDVEQHLCVLVQSGELGRVLFGKAWGEVAANKVATILKAHVKELLDKLQITAEVLQQSLKELSQKVKDVGKNISDVFPEPHDCTVTFLGAVLKVPASSHLEEYNVLVWVRLKEWAIKTGVLPPVWGEQHLIFEGAMLAFHDDFHVSAAVMNEVIAARKVAISYMKEPVITAMDVDAVLVEHGAFLIQVDKRFKIEKSFFQHMLHCGASRLLKDKVLQCLPRAAGCAADDCVGRLAALSQSELFQWVGHGGQSLCLSVLDIVRSLAANKAPKF